MSKMINNRYRSDFVKNLKSQSEGFKQNIKLIEWKLALYLFCFSIFVIAAKLFHANRKELYGILYEDKLISYKTIEKNGEAMLHYTHTTVMKTSYILLPVLCGLLMTAFTWSMIYLDSSEPGIKPPSPLSPDKYKQQSGHVFHMAYIIAIINGMMVFVLMFLSSQDLF